MKVSAFILLSLLMCTGFTGRAQVTAPTYSNEFLRIGAGARSLAMGNTGTASALPAEGGYWNPALLSALDSGSHYLSFMHSEYFGGVAAYDYLAYASKIDAGSSLSLTMLRMGVDDIPDTRLLYDAGGAIDYEAVTFFSAVDYAFLISYARENILVDGMDLGANVKVIHRRAGELTRAWGFGLDISAVYSIDSWTLGAVLRDATGTFTTWTHSVELREAVLEDSGYELPENTVEATLPLLSLGGTYRLVDSGNHSVALVADLNMYFDGKRNTVLKSNFASIDPSFGLEWAIVEKLFIRSGLTRWQQSRLTGKWFVEYTGGVGFRYGQLLFNYALNRNNGFTDTHYSHSFSLNIQLKK